MMHKDTMLKFGALFDLAKYFKHTQKAYEVRHGASSPHIKFWDTLFISVTNGARELKFTRTSVWYKICQLGDVWGNQELPLFILRPPHISETNAARLLERRNLVRW